MNLALNPFNGHLYLPSYQFLTPSLQPNEIEALAATRPPIRRDMGNGWVWYDLRFELPPARFNLSLSFLGTRLRSCIFGLPVERPASDWSTWGEKQERRRASVYDAWLTEQVGPDRTFTWGQAWASYDPRSGGSSLGLRYTGA